MSSDGDEAQDVLQNGNQSLLNDRPIGQGPAREQADPLSAEQVADVGGVDQDALPDFQDGQDEQPVAGEVDQALQDHTASTDGGPLGKDVADDPISSLDDTASIPDDTPSVQGSVFSSPGGSRAPSIQSPARQGSPSSTHRPFERRFHSRITSGNILTSRNSSPSFLGSHSRQTSYGSVALPPASEAEESAAPWEVIRWARLKKLTGRLFTEASKRAFGSPTCLAVTDQIVIGTSRGMVLVFDQQQNHKATIGAGTKAVESGAVTALATSADHTTVAAGHASGQIFTWEVSKPGRPFLNITPIENLQGQSRRGDGHLSGSSVAHIGFLGYRRTALVSADDRGMAFSHLATRGAGAVGRAVRTTRILGRYPEVISRTAKPLKKSSVLAFAPLPLGNVEQKIDGLGLVAMLTPYLLVVVSTTPIAQTQHKAARPREVAAHSAMTAALAWFPAIKLKGSDSEVSKPKLAFAWSNILTVAEVSEIESDDEADRGKPPELQFLTRSRFKAEEAIVAIQWLSKSVLAVLTITQQLMIIEGSTMILNDSFDLLPKNVLHTDLYSQQLQAVIESLDEEDHSMHGVVADAFHMSFRAYKGRLFLLCYNDVWSGSLTNWADRLLALMKIGDFIAAIRLATRYYAGYGENLTIGLPEDDDTRRTLVGEKLYEMVTASLRYAFGKNQQASSEPIEKPQLGELAVACTAACLITEDQNFLFEEVFQWFNDHEEGNLFIDVLEPYILDGTLTSLPPIAFKTMIDHFAVKHDPSKLEEIICLLDTSTMDIDQVTSLCKQYNLYDAYIYVWNNALIDFVSPLDDLLQLASESAGMNGHSNIAVSRTENSSKIFPYISYVLTSRTYPTGAPLKDDIADSAKAQIYDYFFSAGLQKSGGDRRGRQKERAETPYSKLRKILLYDTPSFMACMNEAFEDSFLNADDDSPVAGASMAQKTTRNRQYIIRILLEVMTTNFEPQDSIYLDMFIARNLPKYPQYMLLRDSTLQEVFTRLCHYPEASMQEDAQLSAEYLLSVYHPSTLTSLIPTLLEAGFFRILKGVYRQEKQYADVVRMFFLDDESKDGIFSTVREFLGPLSDISDKDKSEIRNLVEEHIEDLLDIDISGSALMVDDTVPNLHPNFLGAMLDDALRQYEYLEVLLEPVNDATRSQRKRPNVMLETYVRLMCKLRPDHVRDYVDVVKEGDLRLEEVLPSMEKTGILDAAIVLEARSGRVEASMSRLTSHLSSLSSALSGLLSQASTRAREDDLREAVQEIMNSIDKYSKVGIWLCQGQSKTLPRAGSTTKTTKRASSMAQPLSLQETLWLHLVESVVAIARAVSRVDQQQRDLTDILSPLRVVIQQVFTALLAATSSSAKGSARSNDFTFLRILRTFLSSAAETSPSLSELRSVLKSIFSAYAYEESLLALSNQMLDKDVFVHLDKVQALRQRGWRPRGQVCEACRRRVWGPGTGGQAWEGWQRKEKERKLHQSKRFNVEPDMSSDGSRGKGKAVVAESNIAEDMFQTEEVVSGSQSHELGALVVFSCRHLYHQKCLVGQQPQGEGPLPGVSSEEGVQLTCPACVASI